MSIYGKKLKCIDEPYSILGDFNTDRAIALMTVIEKCNPEVRSCKSEAEIDAWLRGKYLFTYSNEKEFI